MEIGSTPVYEQLKMGIRRRIVTGDFALGSRLPTVRKMAEQLGVNKNTVLRAYRELTAEGLLEVQKGRGVYVRQLPIGDSQDVSSLGALVTQVLRTAKVLGLSESEVRDLIETSMLSTFQDQPRVAFVECHMYDAQSLADELQYELGIPVEPVLLTDFTDDPDTYFRKYDLVLTIFFHYSEVCNAAGPHHIASVVGLDHTASVDSLKSLSSIPRGKVVGLVCKNERTLERLLKLVTMYYPEIQHTCLLSDRLKLERMLNDCDVILDHSESVRGLYDTSVPCQIITLNFRITEQSLQYLKNRIAKLQMAV